MPVTIKRRGAMLIVPKNIHCVQREAALELGESICLAVETLAKRTIAAECALSVTIRDDIGRARISVFADEYPGDSQDDLGQLKAWAERIIAEIIPADYDTTVMYAGEHDNEATIIAERNKEKE